MTTARLPKEIGSDTTPQSPDGGERYTRPAGRTEWRRMGDGVEVDYTDELALVDALRAGDEGAFSWLLDRHDASLHRLARNYVATSAVADEVVQETWLGVIQGIGRFEGRSSLKTWLYRILMNVARSRGVKEHRSIPFASLAGALDEGAEPAVDPERFQPAGSRGAGGWAAPPTPWDEEPEPRMLSSETLGVVAAAIERLPAAQREVITLRDLEGWSAADACNALDVSETNQRVLLHRARSKVRQALESYFEEAS
jgi:RNA polymerase sigma-70 factor (ECF subfamily)